MIKVQALNSYILIEPVTEAKETETGLVVPTVKGERTESVAVEAKVVQVPESVMTTAGIKPGDTVWVAKWEIHVCWVAGKQYGVVKEEHLLLKQIEE